MHRYILYQNFRMFPLVLCPLLPPFETVDCFICSRRRVTIARYRMIRLVLTYSKWYLHIEHCIFLRFSALENNFVWTYSSSMTDTSERRIWLGISRMYILVYTLYRNVIIDHIQQCWIYIQWRIYTVNWLLFVMYQFSQFSSVPSMTNLRTDE